MSRGFTPAYIGSPVFAWFHSGGPCGGRVHSGARWLSWARLGVVGIIRDSVGLIGRELGLVWFIRFCMVSLGFALGWSGSLRFSWITRVLRNVAEIIRFRMGHTFAPKGHLVHSD